MAADRRRTALAALPALLLLACGGEPAAPGAATDTAPDRPAPGRRYDPDHGPGPELRVLETVKEGRSVYRAAETGDGSRTASLSGR